MANNFFDNNDINTVFDEMKMVYLNDNRPWIIGYSGGKDSTVVVELVFQMLLDLPPEKRNKQVYVVSSDTLIENPIILSYLRNNIDLINKTSQKANLPISAHLVTPDSNDSFWANIIGRGYPTPKSIQYRWCTERLKIKPSNKFIKEKLESEDVVVLLGVRKDESSARKRRIENRQIDGYLLTPHESLKNNKHIAYVYSPIVDFSTNDVWTVLLNHYNHKTPWGTDNNDLFALYSKGSGYEGECPFIADSSSNSTCGNSRFGCWICTVVNEDKSLNGFIESGEEWLIPLAEFREWIISIRDIPKYRKKHKRNGSVHKNKEGKKTFGPFTFEARQLILEKLLETQKHMQEVNPDIELITFDELKAIDKIWDFEEDLKRTTLVHLYSRITGKSLPWDSFKKPLFDDKALELMKSKCESHDINSDLLNRLIVDVSNYKHFSNPTKLKNAINKTLNQQWVHYDIVEEIDSHAIKETSNENK